MPHRHPIVGIACGVDVGTAQGDLATKRMPIARAYDTLPVGGALVV
jgi:hypothetical protein